MSIYGNLEFIDRQYTPRPDEVILLYRVEPARGISLARAAEFIAGESSIGTWTTIQTMNEAHPETARLPAGHEALARRDRLSGTPLRTRQPAGPAQQHRRQHLRHERP